LALYAFVKLGASITAWNKPRNPAYTRYRRTGRDACYHADAQIYPALGNIEVQSLQPETIRRWQADLVKSAEFVVRVQPSRKGLGERFRSDAA
jgi:hypothetical protein